MTVKELEKIKKFAAKEKDWVAAEFDYLNKLKEDIASKKIGEAKGHYTQVGRAERRVFRFLNKLDKELGKTIEMLSPDYANKCKEISDTLKLNARNILKHTSRYEGSLRECLDKLALKSRLLEKAKKDNLKTRIQTDIDLLWNTLGKSVEEVIKWTHALQIEIQRLENFEQELEKMAA